MIQSFISYFILISSIFTLSLLYTRQTNVTRIHFKDPIIILIILIYVIFCAIRYDVGVDYMGYYKEYVDSKRYTSYESLVNKESLWAYFTWYLSNRNIHYTIYFGIISAIQFLFVLKAFYREAYLLPYLILSFFFGCFFLNFQNVLRQNIVMSIFLYLVMRKRDVNIIIYVAVVAICMLIHKSSFVMLLLYPLVKYKLPFNNHIKILITIYILSVIIGYSMDLFSKVASSEFILSQIKETEYGVYASDQYIGLGTGKTMGIGFLLKVIFDGILICSYSKMHKFFKSDKGFDIYFQLFFLGTCLHYLFPSSMVIGRPILYLQFFALPIYAYYLYYVKHTLTKRLTVKNSINIIAINIFILLFLTNYFVNSDGFKSEFHYYWENPLEH